MLRDDYDGGLVWRLEDGDYEPISAEVWRDRKFPMTIRCSRCFGESEVEEVAYSETPVVVNGTCQGEKCGKKLIATVEFCDYSKQTPRATKVEDKAVAQVVKALLIESLQAGKVAHYIGYNQPPSRDFQIECDRCGCKSTSSTIYFDKGEHERTLSAWEEDARDMMEEFLIYAPPGVDCQVALTGVCLDCGKRLQAIVEFVGH